MTQEGSRTLPLSPTWLKTPSANQPVKMTHPSRATCAASAPCRPDRSVPHEWVHHETLTRVRTTTPPTTLVEDSRLCAGTRSSPLRASHLTSDSKQVWAEMTATLSAELEGRVPPGLVAEIVRAVLDERRQTAPGHAVEFTMLEARQRAERFIRARSSR
jgi:hypothetical protein